MRRRFLIIDNALQTMVGHFYEYDVSVMANLPDDFEGRIFSNVDAPPELDGPTVPYFQCGFWALSAGRRRSAAEDVSPRRPGPVVAPASDRTATPAESLAAPALPPPTWLDRLKFAGKQLEQRHSHRRWARAALRVGKPLYYACRARQWRRDAGEVAPAGAGPVEAPLEAVLGRGDQVLRDVFARDLGDLLAELDLGPEDVLFFPNMNHWAFAAVLGLLDAHPHPERLPACKLLFRRNVFRGRPTASQYRSDDPSMRLFRALFAKLETLDASRLAFFTDTRRLKDEYEVFSPAPFHVLPIPFRHDYIRPKAEPGRPLRVTYLGNARSEKGFQHIPSLVARLRDRIERGEVEFVLQAVPDPEPVILDTVARLRAGGLVTLLEQPLSDRAYYDLISQADLLLLLYDPIQYYSRSSCIFVESMVSGTPFLTMAGSWMADSMTPGTGEVAADVAELPDRLERLVVDYPQYFDACQRASREWREFHNARRLVDVLLGAPGAGRVAA